MSSFWPEEAELRAIPAAEPTREADYLRQLGRLLDLVDRAMSDEDIPAATRDRVRNRVLHGTPTQGDTAEPRDLAVVDALADDSNSGPGWPARRFVAPVDGVT